MKLYKRDIKKLTEKFKVTDRWNTQDSTVEITGFFNADNRANSGRNSMNTLCKLETRYFQCYNINFKRLCDWKSNSDKNDIAIYMNTVCREYTDKEHVYIELKDDKNEVYSIHVPTRFSNLEHFKSWFKESRLYYLFGYNYPSGMYKMYYDADDLSRMGVMDNLNNRFLKFIRSRYRITDSFIYNKVIKIFTISDLVESKNISTFTYKETNTYESRPYEVKVKRNAEIETVRLSEIGGETSGYYNHSESLNIHKSQLEDAKKFINRVNKRLK